MRGLLNRGLKSCCATQCSFAPPHPLRGSTQTVRAMLSTTWSSDEREMFAVASRSRVLSHMSPEALELTFETLHLPVLRFLFREFRNQSEKQPIKLRPMFVGVSAPQGCGKTTLTTVLVEVLSSFGLHVAAMSLDDFYLTGAKHESLAMRFPDNPLIRYRGNAGTHDLSLLSETMTRLRSSQPVRLPRFDKSLRGGRGDRLAPSDSDEVVERANIVLLEGWMLGFQALDDESALPPRPGIGYVNELLRLYTPLHLSFDHWVVMKLCGATPAETVLRWRSEAEQRMSGGGRLSDDQLRDFVDRFLPAYEAYLPGLYSNGPERARGGDVRVLQLSVDANRRVLQSCEYSDQPPAAKL